MSEMLEVPKVRVSANNESSTFDLLIVLVKFRRVVIGAPLVAAIISTLVSMMMPNVYQSTTKLLPPQQAQSGAAALLSQLGGMSSLAAGVAGIKNPNDLYIGMLSSRTVADRLISNFGLTKVYDSDSQEETRKELASNTIINSGKDGLITITVEDVNKKLAMQLANGYVDELRQLTKKLAVTEAGQRRMFFEQQLELAKNNLATAEIKLKSALNTHGVTSVDAESRALVETVARMRAQVSAKEIQLGAMRAFVTPSNPAYQQVQQELSSLRAELSKLENGRPNSGNTKESSGSTQGLENIRTLRDVKYYQMLYELLAKQYEVARLDEAKDASLIQVLDQAVEAERKSKPRRAVIIILSSLFALFGALAYAFMSEAKSRALATPEGAIRWKELKLHLRKS